jgi:hypothetical protein
MFSSGTRIRVRVLMHSPPCSRAQSAEQNSLILFETIKNCDLQSLVLFSFAVTVYTRIVIFSLCSLLRNLSLETETKCIVTSCLHTGKLAGCLLACTGKLCRVYGWSDALSFLHALPIYSGSGPQILTSCASIIPDATLFCNEKCAHNRHKRKEREGDGCDLLAKS